MDILEELTTEHRSLIAILEHLEKLSTDHARRSRAGDPIAATVSEASDTLDRLSSRMRTHQDQERKFLFPAIRQRAPGSAPLLDAMLKEHSRLEQLLAQAISCVPSTARRSTHRFGAALKGFDAAFRAHLRKEETEIFSLAQTGFTKDELDGLAQEEESQEFPEYVDQGGGN